MSTSTSSDSTKRLMIEALKHLLCKKPLNKIGIKEITQLSNLNRQTFYYHFEDIYDMLKWMYQDEVISLIAHHNLSGNWQDGLLHLFHYIEQNKTICLCVYDSLAHQHLRYFIYENSQAIIHKLILSYSDQFSFSTDSKTLTQLTHYYAIASAAMIESWLLGEMTQTPAEMVTFIELITTDHLNGFLLRQNTKFTLAN